MTHDSEILEKFLNHQLSDLELAAFYDKLQNDLDLNDQLAIEVIQSNGKYKLKAQLQEIDKEMQKSKIRRFTFLKIAASILIVISTGLFLWNYLGKMPQNLVVSNHQKSQNTQGIKSPDKTIPIKQKETVAPPKNTSENTTLIVQENAHKYASNDELIREFYAPYMENQLRSSSQDNMAIALDYYESAVYDSALVRFEKFLKSINDADRIDLALFYYANTYLAKGLKSNDTHSLETAKKYFLQFLKDPDYAYYSQSSWYLSLIYLKENKTDSAKFLLQKIVKKHGFRYQEAAKILGKLE